MGLEYIVEAWEQGVSDSVTMVNCSSMRARKCIARQRQQDTMHRRRSSSTRLHDPDYEATTQVSPASHETGYVLIL